MKCARPEHYLVHLWRLCLEIPEDPRAASILTSIDYAKAFNWLDFVCCLKAHVIKGASKGLLSLVASFLTSRTLSVKVSQQFYAPRVVLSGVRQGSILGVFFNATIDCFEAASRDVVNYDTISGAGAPPEGVPQHDSRSDLPLQAPYDRPGFKAW